MGSLAAPEEEDLNSDDEEVEKQGLEVHIENLLCPGCVCGSDTECGSFKPAQTGCDGWVPGTLLCPGGSIALGFPTGFDKIPANSFQRHGRGKFTNRDHHICITQEDLDMFVGDPPFNLIIWWLRRGEYTYLKVYRPRLCYTCVIATPMTPQELVDAGYVLDADKNTENIGGMD